MIFALSLTFRVGMGWIEICCFYCLNNADIELNCNLKRYGGDDLGGYFYW